MSNGWTIAINWKGWRKKHLYFNLRLAPRNLLGGTEENPKISGHRDTNLQSPKYMSEMLPLELPFSILEILLTQHPQSPTDMTSQFFAIYLFNSSSLVVTAHDYNYHNYT